MMDLMMRLHFLLCQQSRAHFRWDGKEHGEDELRREVAVVSPLSVNIHPKLDCRKTERGEHELA